MLWKSLVIVVSWFDPEDGGRLYLRNVDTIHCHSVGNHNPNSHHREAVETYIINWLLSWLHVLVN
jgi:hypothetical protein